MKRLEGKRPADASYPSPAELVKGDELAIFTPLWINLA